MNRIDIVNFINESSLSMEQGNKVLICSRPEVLSMGTIQTEQGKVYMAYDVMIPHDRMYLLHKDEYDSRVI